MSYKKILLSIVILFTLTTFSNAQENNSDNNHAKLLFESTFPLGIYISGKTFSYNEEGDSGPFNHNYSSVWMPDIGMTYNFYQKNRLNFNTSIGGAIFKEYYYSYDENIYNLNSYPTDKLLLHLDITGEYIFYNYKNTSLSLHVGYELLYDGSNHKQIDIKKDPNSTGTIELLTDYSKTKFTHGVNLGLGAYQKLGKRLIKLELNYHIHTNKIIQNRLIATDFPNQPDVDHSVNWNGNHLSAKATFYPFKRSKK